MLFFWLNCVLVVLLSVERCDGRSRRVASTRRWRSTASRCSGFKKHSSCVFGDWFRFICSIISTNMLNRFELRCAARRSSTIARRNDWNTQYRNRYIYFISQSIATSYCCALLLQKRRKSTRTRRRCSCTRCCRSSRCRWLIWSWISWRRRCCARYCCWRRWCQLIIRCRSWHRWNWNNSIKTPKYQPLLFLLPPDFTRCNSRPAW